MHAREAFGKTIPLLSVNVPNGLNRRKLGPFFLNITCFDFFNVNGFFFLFTENSSETIN